MFEVVDELRLGARGRVYAEGWQSWSAATWRPNGAVGPRPEHRRQHLMRFRPDKQLPTHGVQGEGLLVVDPGDGRPVVRYAVGDAVTDVASIRCEPGDDVSRVTADGPVVRSEHSAADAALISWAESFARQAGVSGLRDAPRVWCSWYRYFERVTAADVAENVAGIEAHRLPVDVVQIDDGWSSGIGESTVVSPGFGSLPRIVDRVRSTGRTAGLWLAPFLVGRDSALARSHPDWLVGPAGHNWGQDLAGLDLTHPGVRDLVAGVVRRVVDLGVGYLKLDFLYGGAVPGRRQGGVTPVEAYRSGLQLVRDAAGPDTYLVGCGAPILPSVGLVDAMRVSPDTFHEGAADGSDGLRGRVSLRGRAWQQGRFWVNDPDCLVSRPTFPLREEWARLAATYGGLRSFSDRVAELDDWGLETTRRFLAEAPPPVPFGTGVIRPQAGLALDRPQ